MNKLVTLSSPKNKIKQKSVFILFSLIPSLTFFLSIYRSEFLTCVNVFLSGFPLFFFFFFGLGKFLFLLYFFKDFFFMWIILKSALNLLKYCFCFMFWFFCPQDMLDLISPTRDQTCIPSTGSWGPKYWTTSEVPISPLLLMDNFTEYSILGYLFFFF